MTSNPTQKALTLRKLPKVPHKASRYTTYTYASTIYKGSTRAKEANLRRSATSSRPAFGGGTRGWKVEVRGLMQLAKVGLKRPDLAPTNQSDTKATPQGRASP